MRSDLPNTRFSLSVKPRRGLTESRVRAIVETSNGRRRPTSVPAAVLALLVCLLCVNLVSCAAVRADAGAPSDTQAPTDTQAPAAPPEPSASEPEPTETAPAGEPDPAPERPRDSILKVLTGEGEAHYHYTNSVRGITTDEYLDISEIAVSFIAEGEPARDLAWIARFAAVDLDGDGVNEAVLEGYITDWPMEYMILHLCDGEVRLYSVVARGMEDLKTDGTHGWDSGVTYSGYRRITGFTDETYDLECDDFLYYEYDFDTHITSYYIDHQPVSARAFNKAEEEQRNKPDVEWHDFAGADFSLYFT